MSDELRDRLAELAAAERALGKAEVDLTRLRGSVDAAGELALYDQVRGAEQRLVETSQQIENAFGIDSDA